MCQSYPFFYRSAIDFKLHQSFKLHFERTMALQARDHSHPQCSRSRQTYSAALSTCTTTRSSFPHIITTPLLPTSFQNHIIPVPTLTNSLNTTLSHITPPLPFTMVIFTTSPVLGTTTIPHNPIPPHNNITTTNDNPTPHTASPPFCSQTIGAPDEEPEQWIKELGAKALMSDGIHQYQRSQGAAPLVKALAGLYSPQLNREIDPMTEIHVGIGATEIGFCAFQTLVNPGDEVVLFEPFFDCYQAWGKIAGADMKYVPLKHYKQLQNPCITSTQQNDILRADDWTFDSAQLEATITEKTRILLLNTPHNPLGKIFKNEELEFIAKVVQKYPNLIVISDEVYDCLTHYDTGIEYKVRGLEQPQQDAQQQHEKNPLNDAPAPTRIATLPGMWERTLTVSSAGKTFNITGWKVGWAIGPANLVQPLHLGHQWVSFSLASPLQHALAQIITQAQENGYYKRLATFYTQKRDALYRGLYDAGLNPIYPSAGYFVVCDLEQVIPALGLNKDEVDPNDLGIKMAENLTTRVGVTSIPVSEFYSEQNKTLGNTLLRFAYCKKVEMIESASKILLDWKNGEKKQ